MCDEVTSSVDAFAEKEIVETLRKASDSRTTITVAHRLSSVAHCDKIIVIYRGTVAEEGTHDELLRIPNGVYKNMWDAQHTYIVDDGITPYTQDDTMIMSELPKTNTVVHDYGEVGKRTAHTPEKHEDESLMYVPKAEDEGLSSISTEDTMSESLTSQDTANMSNAEHAMAMRKEEKDISMVGGGDAANTGSTVSGTSSIVAHSASPATTVTTTQKDVVEVQIPNGEMSGTTFVSVPSGGMNTASISLDEAMDLNKNNHED